jgi:hypothetical protein
MSKLHVTQIAGYLRRHLENRIDLSDYDHHSAPAAREKAFLTRGLAALALSHLTDRSITEFTENITDGSFDCGIDFIYFDEIEKILYFGQTKWHESGNGSIDQGDCLKFIAGVKKIIELDLENFNNRVQCHRKNIENALYDANVRIVLVIAHTGSDTLSTVVASELKSYMDQQNDTSEIMTLDILDQSILHKAVSAGIAGAPIDIDVQLINWGQVREPHKAIYGRVFASDVANWFQVFGSKLFEKNLRQFLPASTVNQDLVKTLLNNPDEFWYFNNGITAIARAVEKKPLGGHQTDTGIWECKGFSVVNGAQTVGSIHFAHSTNSEKTGNATVSVRIIETPEDDESFGINVTRNTNTQNAVEKRDFVALDPEQERIQQELKFDGIDYTFKSGATKGDPSKHFDLTEASIALACSHPDVGLAVQAKREISRLWDDIKKPPYRSLFNPSISGPHVWTTVQILRQIEKELASLTHNMSGRKTLICIHGNRFIQWLVFQKLKINTQTKFSEVEKQIAPTTKGALDAVISEVQNTYSDSYPASLFKNAAKCKAISEKVK